jgi:serine/threonine protein kinase
MNIYPPGARIAGQYEVAGRPLVGGMGIVYMCLDHEEDRPVALKTFKPEYLPDRAARDRFLREGTAWVDLGAHPHVVRCYRVLRIDPEVYLVLELVAKEQGRDDASLRAWLTPGQPLPVEQALLFGLQIARGMRHAAEVVPGFVHRDLKPENVLVGADHLSNAPTNRLRVTDFGLAAVLESAGQRVDESAISDTGHAPRNTQLTHGIVGTPLYMAPEQWRGESVTTGTDIYAWGCMLYEMLAGQRAAAGHSLSALQRAHCEGDLRPLPPDLPESVRALLTCCLAVEPGERYGDTSPSPCSAP